MATLPDWSSSFNSTPTFGSESGGWPSSGDWSNGGDWYAPPSGSSLTSTAGTPGEAQGFLSKFLGDMGQSTWSSMQGGGFDMNSFGQVAAFPAGMDLVTSLAYQKLQLPIAMGTIEANRYNNIQTAADQSYLGAISREESIKDNNVAKDIGLLQHQARYGLSNKTPGEMALYGFGATTRTKEGWKIPTV